jgi:hypothetical protein
LNGLSMKVMNPRGLRHCKLSGRWKIKKRFLSLESDLARNAWALQMERLDSVLTGFLFSSKSLLLFYFFIAFDDYSECYAEQWKCYF